MKKFIVRDKILLWSVIIYMIYLPVNMIIMLNYGDKLQTGFVSCMFSYIAIIPSTIAFIFLAVNLKRIVVRVQIKDNTLYYGLLKSKIIDISALKKIKYTDKIELFTKGNNIKIDVLSLDRNKEKYIEILDLIDSKTKLKLNPKASLVGVAKNIEAKYNGISLRFKGLLKWIAIFLTYEVVYYVVIVLAWMLFDREYLLAKNINVFQFILAIILLPLGLYMLVHLLSRHIKTVSIIKKYIWITRIIGCLVAILTLIFIEQSILLSDYGELILHQIFVIIPTIIFLRYLTLSYKVKNTFINTKLFVKHPRMKKEKVQLLGTTKRKIIALVLVGFVLLVGVKVIKYYSIRDTRTYHSVQEIIDRKYKKKDVEYISIDDYYYLIIKDEYVNDRELVFRSNDSFVFVNNLNKETKDYWFKAHSISDEDRNYYMSMSIYIHRDKHVVLLSLIRDREGEQARIYDNYGERDRTTILGDDYCYFVLDKEELNEEYEMYISYGDEIIFTATQKDFMYIHPRDRR